MTETSFFVIEISSRTNVRGPQIPMRFPAKSYEEERSAPGKHCCGDLHICKVDATTRAEITGRHGECANTQNRLIKRNSVAPEPHGGSRGNPNRGGRASWSRDSARASTHGPGRRKQRRRSYTCVRAWRLVSRGHGGEFRSLHGRASVLTPRGFSS